MSYNNYFPATYQPVSYQPYPTQSNAFPTQSNAFPTYSNAYSTQPSVGTSQSGIIWVQGEAGAKAYPLAPGSNILLMDSETECFYIKSTDPSGMPMPLRTFQYKEVFPSEAIETKQSHDNAPNLDDSYAKREDLDEIRELIDDLSKQLSKMTPSKGEKSNGK